MKRALENKICPWVRNAIRVVIWKQWKIPCKQISLLVKLEINEEEAKGLTYCRRGYQFKSHSFVIQRAISNSRLKRRGLLDHLEYYLKPIAFKPPYTEDRTYGGVRGSGETMVSHSLLDVE